VLLVAGRFVSPIIPPVRYSGSDAATEAASGIAELLVMVNKERYYCRPFALHLMLCCFLLLH
jgi:hypothetical protein